jgi:threonine/homoserine/homoserine lactone efflux protein
MPWVFTILQILGLLVLVYHAYRILTRWRAHGLTVWINILHVFTVAPLLIYIGCMGYDTPRWAFEVMAMFGFAVIGYHIYSMVMQIQRIDDKKSLDAEKLTFKQ